MNFIDPKIEHYAMQVSSEEPLHLQKLSRETNLKTYMPRMLSGHLQGRILSLFSKMLQPKLIVEVGTFTGYSASCLSEGLVENGKLITFELNDEMASIAKKHFENSGLDKKIEIRIGNAVELLKKIDDEIDLIFIDADKENYLTYWEILFPKLRSGGILIADNVLWSGKVLDEEKNQDDETRGLISFTKKVMSEKNCDRVLFPVRDGLLVIRKH